MTKTKRPGGGMTWWKIAGAAGFGGIAPNLFRVGIQLQHGDGPPQSSYLFGVAIFFGMGAMLGLFLEQESMKKAFFLGMSLPGMFQGAVSDISEHVNENVSMGLGVVHAQENRIEDLRIYYKEGTPEFFVVFADGNGQREKRVPATPPNLASSSERYVDLEVPDFARVFFLEIPHAASRTREVLSRHRIPLTYYADYDIEITRDPWMGFKRAVGVRGSPGYTIWIHARERTR